MIHADVIIAAPPAPPTTELSEPEAAPQTPRPETARRTKPAPRRPSSRTPKTPAQREKEDTPS